MLNNLNKARFKPVFSSINKDTIQRLSEIKMHSSKDFKSKNSISFMKTKTYHIS